MSGEILPCPFCSGFDLEIWPVKGVAEVVIQCTTCKASIAKANELLAIEAWNKREWTGYD